MCQGRGTAQGHGAHGPGSCGRDVPWAQEGVAPGSCQHGQRQSCSLGTQRDNSSARNGKQGTVTTGSRGPAALQGAPGQRFWPWKGTPGWHVALTAGSTNHPAQSHAAEPRPLGRSWHKQLARSVPKRPKICCSGMRWQEVMGRGPHATSELKQGEGSVPKSASPKLQHPQISVPKAPVSPKGSGVK